MSRTERNILAAMAVIITLMAARIVRAQGHSGVHRPAEGAVHAAPANSSAANTSPMAAGQIANDDETVLVLAMAAVAEATWRESDHAGVLHVIRKRAERAGVSLQAMALDYVAAFDPRTVPSDRLRWVLQLNLQATRPEAFPLTLSWSAHVEKWLAVIAMVRAFVADPSSVVDPCPRAVHWAGTGDALRGRMVPARCSVPTANTFVRLERRR